MFVVFPFPSSFFFLTNHGRDKYGIFDVCIERCLLYLEVGGGKPSSGFKGMESEKIKT
jgi:hypothetical protein